MTLNYTLSRVLILAFLYMSALSRGQSPGKLAGQDDILGEMITQLSHRHFEIHLISSTDAEDTAFVDALLGLVNSAPVTRWKLQEIRKRQLQERAEELCPYFQPYEASSTDEDIVFHDDDVQGTFVRKQLMNRRFGIYRKLLIFWVEYSSEIDTILNLLSDSVLNCKQIVEPGLLHAENALMIATRNEDLISKFFNAKVIRDHARVSAMRYGDRIATLKRPRNLPTINLVPDWPDLDSSIRDAVDAIIELPLDFSGEHLTVSTLPWAHLMLTEEVFEAQGTTLYGEYWGYELEILKHMQNKLSFDASIVFPADEQWGYVEEVNGTWTGLIGQLVNKEADLVTSISLSSTRLKSIELSNMHERDYLGWVSPLPVPFSTYHSYINPLQPYVWIGILITLFITSFVLSMYAPAESGLTRSNCPRDWGSLKSAVWYTLGTLMGESITRDTKSEKLPGLRIVVAMWLIFCMIMGYSYTGNLKAHLTTPTVPKPVDSLEGMLESRFTVGIVLYSGEEEDVWLQTSTNPTIQRIWKIKEAIPTSDSPDLSRVYDQELILMEWYSGLMVEVYKRYTQPGTEEPLVFLSPLPVFVYKSTGFGFKKLAPWIRQANDVMRSAMETGLVDQWRLRVLRQIKRNMFARGERSEVVLKRASISPLNLDDLKGTIVLLCGGLIGGLLFTISEILLNISRKSKQL